MSTWNVITVTEAPRLTERKLSKAIDRAGLCLSDEQIIEDEDGWKVCGNSKYEAEGIYDLAADLSRRHTGACVEVLQEWDTRDADEAGQSLDVYTGGERQRARSQESGLVPVDLVQSIAAVRAALGGSGDLAAAARWLIDGLDGSR
ncbi:hypothetical protein DC31_06470 [Microbacterium sp. CH12i]|uniref:hypothetical protein n=1 Tax=Microbacterium sp. CH12i TaxID=1479651 RepID=UPI000461F5A8|nr:hypothetical protein [Microbacterium sp. CH12i]KDA04525.1 hypothetical protein DC31_06470 [Microbacterium sp. CH12i]